MAPSTNVVELLGIESAIMDLHRTAVFVELGAAAVTFVGTLIVAAPYGRHTRAGWGPTVSARTGWMLMESPAVFATTAFFAAGGHRTETVPLALLSLWLFHYVRRAFVYPLRMDARHHRMPVLVVLLAMAFNLLNAYVNAAQMADRGVYPTAWLVDPRFLAGTAIFFVGWRVNVEADARLARLRSASDHRYQIPRGWLYELVSCPNYLGEIVEWLGWALLTWSLAGLAFALYTTANLLPRALAHHRWYRACFPDYPKGRRALVPWLL
jgi:hypothetical protein